jgi:uncharacterized protein (TIGR03083 family)
MTQLDKREVIGGLFKCWDDIDELLSGLSDQQWEAQTALPGWRVHDVVSHMIGTESFLMGVPTPEPNCDVSELPHVHNEIGALNECWVRHLRDEPHGAVLDKFRAVTEERRKALADISDDDWNETSATPAGQDTYGRFMRIRVFDCWMHEQDIRDVVGVWASNDVVADASAEQAFDELTATMGYVVGKLGKAPEGSRVEFDLTGALQRTVRVAVDGRAQVVEDFDGEPTTSILLDAVLFTRLAGGRTTAAENEDAIEISGDVDLGRQIVERLKYTI